MNAGIERRNEVSHPVTMSYVSRKMLEARAALVEMVTPEMLIEVFSALYRRAMEGDTQAAKLFLQYTLGVPRRGVGYLP